MDRRKIQGFVGLAMLFLFFAGLVSADGWQVNSLSEPYSHLEISNDTNTVKLVNLTDENGDPINETELENEVNTNLYYFYPGSSSQEIEMDYLGSGFYFAEFIADNQTGLNITYELEGTAGDIRGWDSQEMSIGNISVTLLEPSFSSKLNPTHTKGFEVNLTDQWNDTHEDSANVSVYFTNVTWTSEIYNLSYDSDNLVYDNSSVDVPDDYGTNYVVHVNASASGEGYSNQFGAYSEVIETLPALDGNITELNATEGCNNESFFRRCERGTEIDTDFNITASEAENVTLYLNLWEDGSGWTENKSVNLTDYNDDSTWNGSVTVPDIDTSNYDHKFQLEYEAVNGTVENSETYNITYETFDIEFKSPSSTEKGDYDFELEFQKFFTPTLLDSSRFQDSHVWINDSDDEKLVNFTFDDMSETDSGSYTKTIDIPISRPKGVYDVEVNATNIFNETKAFEFDFEVDNASIECDYREDPICLQSTDLDASLNESGTKTESFTVLNTGGENHTFEVESSGNISDVMTLGQDNFTLEVEEEETVSVDYSVNESGYYTGDIHVSTNSSNASANVSFPVAVNSTIEPGIGIEVQETVDIGSQNDGGSVFQTASIWLKNTGDVTINNLTFDSTSYDVTSSASDIKPDKNRSVTLTISGEATESEEVTVTANSDSESATDSFTITADITESTVPEETADEETDFNDTGSSTGDEATSQQQDNSGGGSGILIVAAVIFILLVAGFVFVTSYIPEEGDPLYGVLGE